MPIAEVKRSFGKAVRAGKKKRATSVQGDRPIRKRTLLKEQPSPGTMITNPVFGDELFVAHS